MRGPSPITITPRVFIVFAAGVAWRGGHECGGRYCSADAFYIEHFARGLRGEARQAATVTPPDTFFSGLRYDPAVVCNANANTRRALAKFDTAEVNGWSRLKLAQVTRDDRQGPFETSGENSNFGETRVFRVSLSAQATAMTPKRWDLRRLFDRPSPLHGLTTLGPRGGQAALTLTQRSNSAAKDSPGGALPGSAGDVPPSLYPGPLPKWPPWSLHGTTPSPTMT